MDTKKYEYKTYRHSWVALFDPCGPATLWPDRVCGNTQPWKRCTLNKKDNHDTVTVRIEPYCWILTRIKMKSLIRINKRIKKNWPWGTWKVYRELVYDIYCVHKRVQSLASSFILCVLQPVLLVHFCAGGNLANDKYDSLPHEINKTAGSWPKIMWKARTGTTINKTAGSGPE